MWLSLVARVIPHPMNDIERKDRTQRVHFLGVTNIGRVAKKLKSIDREGKERV